jgi:hypothetical protein
MKATCNFGGEITPVLIDDILNEIIDCHHRLNQQHFESKKIHGYQISSEFYDKRALLNILFYQNDDFIENILNRVSTIIYHFDFELIYLLLFIAELVNADIEYLIATCRANSIEVHVEEFKNYLLNVENIESSFQYVENKTGVKSFLGANSNIYKIEDFKGTKL